MRRPGRLTAGAALVAAALAMSGCEARVHGTPPEPPHLTVVAPQGSQAPLPVAPPDAPAATFRGLADRARQATDQAAEAGADITAVVLDRNTGQTVTNGNDRGIAIASVVKLFIADEMLRSEQPLSPEDRELFDGMLRRSDDSAAEVFWNRFGGTSIVTKVAARYGLTGTRPPSNGRWFNTISTAADLVRFYDILLSGAGGLPADRVDMIVNNLFAAAPIGLDGTQPGGTYPQRFGIPDGLPGERVGFKQGWMCCVGSDWVHLSTGIIGDDRRYVMVVGSDQPTSDDAARDTITQFVRTMFPEGRISG